LYNVYCSPDYQANNIYYTPKSFTWLEEEIAMDNNALWYISERWVYPNEASISINDVAVLHGY